MITIYAARRTYAIFVGFWGALAIISLLGAVHTGRFDIAGLEVAIVGGAISAATIARYRVCWGEKELIYRSLTRTRCINLADVTKIDVRGPAGDRYGPTLGLGVYTKDKKRPALVINLKVFSQHDIGLLIDQLRRSSHLIG